MSIKLDVGENILKLSRPIVIPDLYILVGKKPCIRSIDVWFSILPTIELTMKRKQNIIFELKITLVIITFYNSCLGPLHGQSYMEFS